MTYQKTRSPSRRWVALPETVGRTPKGVYLRFVAVSGDRAFVYNSLSSGQAIIIPRSCVFSSEKDAAQYFAAGGTPRWCVSVQNFKPSFKKFLARVQSLGYDRYSGRQEVRRKFFSPATNQMLDVDCREVHTFDTEKEADAYLEKVAKSAEKRLTFTLQRVKEELRSVRKISPKRVR